ncbi:hypothetical protein GGS26DRAFT_596439 [Hypomontagnella submonticulosa]|nr:hypothetical protein GGS26DRAFT_596439 [Hypomontagnella submonticulosa]
MAITRNLFAKAVMALGLTKILAFAAPNATAVLLGSDCTAYPNYDNATGIAEPLRVVVDSTGKELDGFKFIPKYAIAVGGGSWGFMVIPTAENTTAGVADVPFRCANGTLQAHLNIGMAGDRWQTLIAAGTPAESYVVNPLGAPYLRCHSHILDGVAQEGAYLGAVNVTNWGFIYQNHTETGEYYFLRLLGPNSNDPATGKQLFPGEFTGYIKVTAA